MHTATHGSSLLRRATFALVLTLGLTGSVAAFGQDEQAEEKKSIATQIQELVADLEARKVCKTCVFTTQQLQWDPYRATDFFISYIPIS